MAKNVVIIGGGASGLMAAIWASRLGAAVTVLEKNDKPGRKLLATGNGRCNFTNRYQDASCYRTGNQERASRVLEQFTEQDTEQFFEQLGIRIRSREGWLYPASEQAQSVLELLILEARFRKVKIKTRETAVAVEKAENGYLVRTEGWQYPADSVIICCGSCASQIAGSDGDTLRFADQLQLASIPFFPALCPLRCKGNQFSSWAGVRVRAKITLLVENQEILTEQGELQLTDYGVSGIPVFQISRFAVRACMQKKRVELLVDFFPELTELELTAELVRRQEICPYKAPKELLIGLLPEKLIPVLIGKKKIPEERRHQIISFTDHRPDRLWKSPGVCGRHHARPAYGFSGIGTAPWYFLCGRSPGRRRRLRRLQSPVGLVQRKCSRKSCSRRTCMIRIQQLKLPVTHTQEELEQKIRKTLKIGKHDLQEIELLRRSIDARKKSELKYVYQLDVKVKDENAVLRKAKNNQIVKAEKKSYVFPKSGEQTLVHRPVIIGSGPAGLFCAYVLAKHGYRPLVLERGESAEQRKKSVDAFWKTGVLNPESNVQFGEGGAGTFSDGKLNTSVKDPSGRNREVLRIFTECGAPEEILYDQKPHLGTDQLIGIVTTMRKKIEAWGGEVRFGAKVTDFGIENGRLTSITVNETEKIAAETAVLAIGHSARDTFFKLCENKISMEAKSFAVGVRIEHPQKMITEDQYGPEAPDFLGAAPYKLTNQCENGRGVYSFCMCPGGYVVNASSEAERTCVNGMSYSDREGKNANSAMIVTVTPEDYRPYHVEGTPDVLDGVAFQRALEHAAWEAGKGKVPVQLFGDFCENRVSTALGEVTPSICGEWTFANLREVLPTFIGDSLVEGIRASERKIHGFSRPDAVLSGVEARTSSPVRIVRNETLESSSLTGLYPCGEGAGYAGGITSAAMDGLKTAEEIAKKYMNFS